MTEATRERFNWGQWTPEEDAFILANRGQMTAKELGLKVGRTAAAVTRRFQTMPKPEAANGSEPEPPPEPVTAAPTEAPPWPSGRTLREVIRGDIEHAVCGMSELLFRYEMGWDRQDGFYAIKLLLEAWDLLRGLEQ